MIIWATVKIFEALYSMKIPSDGLDWFRTFSFIELLVELTAAVVGIGFLITYLADREKS